MKLFIPSTSLISIRIAQKEIEKELLFYYNGKKQTLQKDVYRGGYFQACESTVYHKYNEKQWEALLEQINASTTATIVSFR